MSPKIINQLSLLRIAVAYLGESKKWWRSDFYKPDSEIFIDFVFPKSKHANIIASFEVASSEIGKHVGVNYYHLFRLGIKNEELIYRSIQEMEVNIKSDEEALEMLKQISEGIGIDESPGPKNIGSIEQLFEGDIVAVMAAEFFAAFKDNYKVYPYLN